MRTLCIDTSGPAVISLVDGQTILAEAVEPNARRHAESLGLLLGEILEALDLQDLPGAGIDRVCVGVGPGPFTGLRAGIIFASTLGRGLGVPVLGVGSLEALARQAIDEVEVSEQTLRIGSSETPALSESDQVALPASENLRVLVVTDAKRHEIYWAIYGAKGADDVQSIEGPNVGPATEALTNAIDRGVKAIAGPRATLESLREVLEENSAEGARLGETVLVPLDVNPAVFPRIVDTRADDEFPLTPLYLRRPDIHGQPTILMPPN
ncbi:tRNA (adenosine(37)-N6)-threonylcarbamoyltransferase complex dimerization subunit type 1 TsaB [Actinomycetaceae bacterium MB13-C1-2]|nr:tRNA (adenosine(37)-N6)-threonylcarbamoyltransferase complex dimerization subunit type 1 TsaB [Actinomycetaceae bacterium MB13-C1-2]